MVYCNKLWIIDMLVFIYLCSPRLDVPANEKLGDDFNEKRIWIKLCVDYRC